MYKGSFYHVNRKEVRDRESIQLPDTFRPKHQRERKTHLKHGTTAKTLQAETQKDMFYGQTAIKNENFIRSDMQRHTTTEMVKRNRCIFIKGYLLWLFKGGESKYQTIIFWSNSTPHKNQRGRHSMKMHVFFFQIYMIKRIFWHYLEQSIMIAWSKSGEGQYIMIKYFDPPPHPLTSLDLKIQRWRHLAKMHFSGLHYSTITF